MSGTADREGRRRRGWARVLATLLGLVLAFAAVSPVRTRAQETRQTTGAAPDAADRAARALAACDAAADAADEEAMEAAAGRAESAAEALEPSDPVETAVVRAQVLTRCRIPFAGFMRQGSLLAESNALLERALERAPSHLGAWFFLGMNHYHTPAFLGRTDAAIAAFSRLLAEHGDAPDPRVAAAYLYLGRLYERVGRGDDAARTWRAGAARFPDHAALRERVEGVRSTGGGSPAEAAGATSGAASGAAVPRYRLPPLVVEAGGYSMEDPRTATRLTKLDVYTLPGGTADVLQTFQALPGVTRVGDGADLYVRGGDPAESPIYVDGARLFHPGRFETLDGSVFGVLDPSALRRAYFSSGGFSARYGNALSGIVDIETEGRPVERQWRLGVNLTSVAGTLWQPLGPELGAWSTGSITSTTPLLALHGRREEYPESPKAAQGMAGLVWEPGPAIEIRGSSLIEADRTTARVSAGGYDGAFRSDASTRLAAASVRVLARDGGAGLRLSGGASVRDGGFDFGVLERERADRSLSARLDGDLAVGTPVAAGGLRLRAGLEVARMDAERSGSVPAGEELAPGSPVVVLEGEEGTASHFGGYAEAEGRLTGRLAVIAGVRADELPGEDAWTVDPRLALAYRLEDWTARVGGGLFSQGRWRTRYALPDGGRPAGVPLRARHLVAGIQHEGPLAVRAEAYVKRYFDYGGLPSGSGQPTGIGPMTRAGWARGLDLLVRWAGTGRLSGWLTYSWLDADIALVGGERVPAEYDVTHTATAVTRTSIADGWELGLTARYATGRPVTPVVGAAAPTEDRPVAPLYGALHSERYPAYLRLDARITRTVPLAGGTLVTYLEALNVLDRANVTGYTYDATYRERRRTASFFGDRTLVLGAEARF